MILCGGNLDRLGLFVNLRLGWLCSCETHASVQRLKEQPIVMGAITGNRVELARHNFKVVPGCDAVLHFVELEKMPMGMAENLAKRLVLGLVE
jgi:hypothetical protein